MKTPARLPRPFLDTSTHEDYWNKTTTYGDKSAIDDALAQVDIHRSLFCPYYRECLNFAVAKGWQGWSCSKCEHHEPNL